MQQGEKQSLNAIKAKETIKCAGAKIIMMKVWTSETVSVCNLSITELLCCVCVCVSELDRDGDGRVSFKDFDFAMKYDVRNHFWFAVNDGHDMYWCYVSLLHTGN